MPRWLWVGLKTFGGRHSQHRLTKHARNGARHGEFGFPPLRKVCAGIHIRFICWFLALATRGLVGLRGRVPANA
jgi:hypothetical protein